MQTMKTVMVGLAVLAMVGLSAQAQDPVGTGTLSRASGWVAAGTPLEVIATPDAESSTFKEWTGDIDSEEIEGDTITFTVNGPRSITATFLINTYTVTFDLDGKGTSSDTLIQSIKHGLGAVAPAVTPDTGWAFTGWDKTFDAVTADMTVMAQYDPIYTLTYSAGTGGSIDGPTPQYVQHGQDGTAVTAVADTGYYFSKWSDNVMTATRQDLSVQGDITVTAEFTQHQYTFTVVSAHGTASPEAGIEHTYAHGQTVNFSIDGSPEIIENDSKFDVTGWVGTGSAPASGTETSGSFVIEQNSTITWQWSTNYWINFEIIGE